MTPEGRKPVTGFDVVDDSCGLVAAIGPFSKIHTRRAKAVARNDSFVATKQKTWVFNELRITHPMASA
jgi:hypothetical protein